MGRHLVDIITALAERGHEIHLIYSPIRVEAAFLEAIQRQPRVRCAPVPMPRAIAASDLEAFRLIRRYVQEHGPFDLVHGHSSKGGGYARLLKLCGIGPILYTPHAFITMCPISMGPKRLVYHAIETALACLTDRVLCSSEVERQHARSLGISRRRIATIIHGAAAAPEEPRDRARQRFGAAPDEIVVGFVGRMVDQKAPDRLITVAQRLLPELPRLVFVMIGEGPRRAALEASLDRTGLGARVRWLGAVNAREHLPGIDILVLSSLYEGFSYVLLEALQAGLPVVSTPVGGAQETVEHGVNGYIVPHGPDDAMAAAIRRLATDHSLRRRMAEASRRRAERFTIARMVDEIEGLYGAILADRGEARHSLPLVGAPIRSV